MKIKFSIHTTISNNFLQNFKNKLYHGVYGFEDVPKVNLPMEKGDTVFFHPILLHGSGPNLTKVK